MSEFEFLKDESTGVYNVKTDVKPCPLCKGTAYMTVREKRLSGILPQSCVATVRCLDCGLRIERCLDYPRASIDGVATLVKQAWNQRVVA